MAAVWLVVRAGLRVRWRSWLALATVAGLAGGLVIAVAAGARRTDAAYPRLVTWSAPPDDLLVLSAAAGQFASVTAPQLRKLPEVVGVAAIDGFDAFNPAAVQVMAPLDGGIPDGIWHRKLLSGGLPDPASPDDADISFTVAQAQHAAVGDTLHVTLLGADGKPFPFAFRVAGIDAAPGEFPPQYGTGIDTVWATPAFARQFAGRLQVIPALAVRLRGGAKDVPALEHRVSRLAGSKVVSDYPLATQAANTRRTIHLQAVVLWLLAGILAVLGLIILWQLLSRLTVLESSGFGELRAIGMRPGQLAAVGVARAALIGGCGAVLAVVAALASSPLFPVGLAATAEPRPGFSADMPALLLGTAGLMAAVLGCSAWPAWHAARAAARAAVAVPPSRRGVLALNRAPRPIALTTGIKLALHRGAGRSAVPVGSTVIASVVGVLGLAAALVFSASLGSLLATPRDYGTDWDAVVSDLAYGGSLDVAARSVAADAAVGRWTGSYSDVPMNVNGIPAGGVTTGPGPDGSLAAVPLAGRPPATPSEIVLGRRTLNALHLRIGDTVTVSAAGLPKHTRLRITGTAVFPALGDTTSLGTGAELTAGGLANLAPAGVRLPSYNAILVKFRPGVDVDAAIAALAARVNEAGPYAVTPRQPPADLVNFGELQQLPLLIGLALAGVALLTIANLLVTAVRRRRRDLAVLRALGFTARQVMATVAWMAVTIAVIALAAGVPLGIICGRVAWLFFAGELGIVPVLVLPPVPIAVLAGAGVILAAGVSAFPAATASRDRCATVLRTE